jgi:acyl carrier protein
MENNPSFAEDKEAQLRAMEEAMIHAVTDMEYESMLQVLKRILALRTHLDERGMSAEMPLQLIFKMAFAREQGIDVEEVYDPIAFADLTDSQLATNNFIVDMQRSFHIAFSEDETLSIKTIKDLVKVIVAKRLES